MTEDIFQKSNEDLVAHVEKLDRKALKELCDGTNLRNVFKLVGLLTDEYKAQVEEFLGKKKNKSAGVRSRNITGSLETVFMVWRKKSIEATKNVALLD